MAAGQVQAFHPGLFLMNLFKFYIIYPELTYIIKGKEKRNQPSNVLDEEVIDAKNRTCHVKQDVKTMRWPECS